MSLAISVLIAMSSKVNLSYTMQRVEDLKLLRKLLKENKIIEYYGKGWIKISGIVINGIDRKDIERIEREINQ